MNDKIGWVVGNRGVIVHTENAGRKWERQGNIKESLHIVFFINETEGWVGGSRGTFLHTRDGGKNWNKENIIIKGDYIAGIFFKNSNTGQIVSGDIIYKTKMGEKMGNK